jgi:hypothetical protein
MVDLEPCNFWKRLWNKILRRQIFIFHSQDYCLPPTTFPAVDYTPDPLNLLKSHPDVLKIEHFPLDDGIRETYRWHVTIKATSRMKIESLLEPYLRISPRYFIYHQNTSMEHYKTNGFYFVQMVVGHSRKNEDLIRETQLLWSRLGWEWIAEDCTCGWISAKAARPRKGNRQC